ncbi:MAG TPA: Rid family detoxifying hydrolase [Roseiarcus sp.]|nr:Rid family detoxifying hydrolase [Roseiarcus sp.]
MTREVINPPGLPAVNPTYSQGIRANGLVFVAGQIGIDPKTGQLVGSDIAGQTRQAMKNLEMILKAAGSSLANVVSTTLYLTEFDQLARVNAVYAEYFPQAGPAKLSCGVTALYGGAKFEIQAIAAA